MFDDRLVERLAQLFTGFSERQVCDAVLVFLTQLGLDDPSRLAPRLRVRLAGIAADPTSLDAPLPLLERIAEAFGAENVRVLEQAGARLGRVTIAKKDAPKPIEQRTSVIGILALQRR
jgi:hypothetical protein